MFFWTKGLPLHMSFRLRIATAEVGRNIYVFFKSIVETALQVYAFNSVTYRWKKIKVKDSKYMPYLDASLGHSTVSYQGRVYFFGGNLFSRAGASILYCFDTETCSWSRPKTTGDIPLPRSRHSACVIGSRMLVYGGVALNEVLASVYSLDLDTMHWRFCSGSSNFHLSRYDHTATAWKNYMVVFGGFRYRNNEDNHHDADENDDGELVDQWNLCLFNTETNTFSARETTGDLPEPRAYHVAFAHDENIFVCAGQRHGQDLPNDLFSLNPISLRWTRHTVPKEMGLVSDRCTYGRCGDKVFIFFFSGQYELGQCQFAILDLNVSLRTLCMDTVHRLLRTSELPRHLLEEMNAILCSDPIPMPSEPDLDF